MIFEAGRDCNIDNIDEYHAMRNEALTNVRAPSPSEYDITQLKEAFANIDGEYDYENAKQHALIWYSDTLYSASELRVIMPKVVPHYNKFDGVKTIQLLTDMYPDALFYLVESMVSLSSFTLRMVRRR